MFVLALIGSSEGFPHTTTGNVKSASKFLKERIYKDNSKIRMSANIEYDEVNHEDRSLAQSKGVWDLVCANQIKMAGSNAVAGGAKLGAEKREQKSQVHRKEC